MAQITIEQVRTMGYDDGAQMAFEALEDGQDPEAYLRTLHNSAVGWDEGLINSIGGEETCRVLGEDPAENAGGWTPAMLTKLHAYNAGAEAGARATVAEWTATDA